MSTPLVRWTSPAAGKTPPEPFLARFEGCGDAIRRLHAPRAESSAGYAATVLRAALAGPPELVIVEDGGRDVARAAFFPCASRERTGAVGMYEALPGEVGDRATSRILDAALAWAASRGLGELVAPVDANTWFANRFVLPEPESSTAPPPYSWEPQNPPEYPERFRRHGFADIERYETRGFWFARDSPYAIENVVAHTRKGWDGAAAAGLSIDRLNGDADVPAFLDELHPVCMEAFAENPLFEPVPPALFGAMYGEGLARARGHLTFYARDGGGRLAGFVFAFPDRDAVVVKTVAVAPRARGVGLSSALLHAVFRAAGEADVERFVSALIRRGNASEFLARPHVLPAADTWLREYVVLGRGVRE
ncbi:MAG TPA: GNAT family N-acetyltransferase [Longimicrobiales bacterium]|nr:GNAT family N-acetyltransferase [Longimicrobiales bacterium]